ASDARRGEEPGRGCGRAMNPLAVQPDKLLHWSFHQAIEVRRLERSRQGKPVQPSRCIGLAQPRDHASGRVVVAPCAERMEAEGGEPIPDGSREYPVQVGSVMEAQPESANRGRPEHLQKNFPRLEYAFRSESTVAGLVSQSREIREPTAKIYLWV